MAIQDWAENIVLVDLSQEPEMGDELQEVMEIVRQRGNCDVVMDFSNADIVTSSSLSKMLKLRKMLTDCGHGLIFCNVAPATKGVFKITGLETIFEFVNDKFTALAEIQLAQI